MYVCVQYTRLTTKKMRLNRNQIAKRIAQEIRDGFTVNLGIGIPTLVSNYIPKDIHIMLHR